jgi:hypothetical protein
MNRNIEDFELLAWKPWVDAVDAYRFLSRMNSPGDHQHWRFYWIAGIAMLRAVGHVLDKVDSNHSDLSKRIISDWWASNKLRRPTIFFEFIEDERNNILKVYKFGAVAYPVTSSTMSDRGLSYAELVRKYGERKIIVWGDERRDGIELMGYALRWWEEELRTIEQSIIERIEQPFKQGRTILDELIARSLLRRKQTEGIP